MSSHGGTTDHERGDEAAAYVLGAMEPEEAQAFRRHLDECDSCREHVSALQKVTAALPMAAPQYRVPPGLKGRVMQSIGAEPGATSRRRAPARPLAGRLPRPALVSGLAVLLVAVAIGAGALLGTGSGGSRITEAEVIGSSGSAQLRIVNNRAELIVRHFPAPPPGRIYEVWLKRGGSPPAPTNTLFTVTRAGAGDIGVVGKLNGVSELMVTAEPDGGSQIPTRSPVIVARLS